MFAVEYLPGQFDQRADSCRPVHPAAQPGGAAHRCAPPRSTSSTATLSAGGAGADQALCHQPGGEPGGRPWSQPETLAMDYAQPDHRGDAGGLHRPGRRRAWRSCWSPLGLAMDLDDLTLLPGLFPGRGAAGPHHHRDPDDGHLLVRPLPPHHLLHPSWTTWRLRTSAVQAAYERYLASRGRRSTGRRRRKPVRP